MKFLFLVPLIEPEEMVVMIYNAAVLGDGAADAVATTDSATGDECIC